MAPLPRVAAVIYSAQELCPALAPTPVSHAHPRVPPRTPTSHLAASYPTLHTHIPPCTLTAHHTRLCPTLHAHILPCTLPSCPHTHIPPCAIASVPSYPTSHIPLVPHTLMSHPTHSYPTLHTHFHDLKSHPAYSSPCPARSCHTPHIPRPRWRLGTSVRRGFVMVSPPWPHPVAFGEGPAALPGWGPPPLTPQNPPLHWGPFSGLGVPCRGSPRLPGPGGTPAALGPFLGCRGRRGGGGPGLPRRARPLISCLTGSLGSAAEKHSQTSRSSRGALNPFLAAPHTGGAPRLC